MVSFILVFLLGLILLNYVAVFITEKVRWGILDTLDIRSKNTYFKRVLQKSYPQYLIHLQIQVLIPLYGVIKGVIFYIKYTKSLNEGNTKFVSLCSVDSK